MSELLIPQVHSASSGQISYGRGVFGWFMCLTALTAATMIAPSAGHAQTAAGANSQILGTVPLQPTLAAVPDLSAAMAEAMKFDDLVEKNTRSAFPGPSESFTKDVGGIRTFLADNGIGFDGNDTDTVEYNVLNNSHPRHPQAYDGQFPTYSGEHQWVITYDASRIGLPGGQFVLAPTAWIASRPVDGPSRLRLSRLSYYQPFFGGKVELKFGYGNLLNEAIGILGIGGNPIAQTNGPTAIIPVEAGFSHYPLTQPYAKLSIHGPDGLYSQTGVARSNSPLGSIYEAANNGIGLRFGAADAKALVYEEVGVERKSAPGQEQLWIRAGGIYNFTHYTQFNGDQSSNNYTVYLLADHQILQSNPTLPFQGIYVGASAFYAPPNVNAFSQYYELRAYTIGLLRSRPRDIMSVVADANLISNQARHAFAAFRATSASSQPGIAFQYTAHVVDGVFVTPAIAYSTDPALTPNYKPALNLALSLLLLY